MSDVLSGTGVPTNDPKNIHDMTAFIQQSLTDMQGKFTNMSDQVILSFHRKIRNNSILSIRVISSNQN